MNKWNPLYTWIIIGVIALVAILTNPGIEVHKSKVKHEFSKVIDEALAEAHHLESGADKDSWASLGAGLGQMFARSMVDGMIDRGVTAQSWILFSLTQMTYEGKTKNIGIGVFGNVFLFNSPSEQLKKAYPGLNK